MSRLLTVGIPTFNRVDYLAESVNSVLEQNLRNVEILILDNASTDNTEEYGQDLASRYSQIRYVRNPHNVGMSANWLKIQQLASGRYIKYLMDDDLLLPGCLDAFCEVIRTYPECSLVACLGPLFQGECPVDVPQPKIYAPERPVAGKLMLSFLNRWCNQIGSPTHVMFRKDALDCVSPYWRHSDKLWGPDFIAFVLALEKGAFYCINKPLVAMRNHPQSGTSTLDDVKKQTEEEFQFEMLAKMAGGAILEYDFAELHSARAALLRSVSNLKRGDLPTAKTFWKRWTNSKMAIPAMRMALSHSWAEILLPSVVRTLGARWMDRISLSNVCHNSSSYGSGKMSYRFKAMEYFWLENDSKL